MTKRCGIYTTSARGDLGACSPRKIWKCTVSQVASGGYLYQTQAFKFRYFIHNNKVNESYIM